MMAAATSSWMGRASTAVSTWHQLQTTPANASLSISCGLAIDDFARQATKPSGRTSTAPVAVIP
jgi:hypothetical protein